MKTQSTTITDGQRLVSAVSRFGSPYEIYGDRLDPLTDTLADELGITLEIEDE